MKFHFVVLVLGVLLFGFGCGYIWFEAIHFDYIKEAPTSSYTVKQEEYRFPLEEDKKYWISSNNGYINRHIDNSLQNEIVLKVSYYKDFGSIIYATSDSTFDNETIKNIRFVTKNYSVVGKWQTLGKMILEDLKERQLHNYSLFFVPVIDVYYNETQKERINVDGIDDEFSDFFERNYAYNG